MPSADRRPNAPMESPHAQNRAPAGALLVAAGIFLSRIAGLVRERVFAHYFGNTDAADAFKAAQRIPNFLQNLFGEGVLSASFIPVYARQLSEKSHVAADQIASVIATLLAIATSIMAVLGVLVTPFLIDVIAPGFVGEKRDLTIQLVQILFPGIALLVMSAWCLGILNSHRRYFLSYVAPVIWNAAIIAAMIAFGQGATQESLAIKTAWGLVVGSLLQFVIQLPVVFKLLGHFRPSLDLRSPHAQSILKNFSAAVVARGVVQISAYVDNILASLLPSGAVAILGYAQTLYLLPISVFGMSVSAASLAEMSRTRGETATASLADANEALRQQLERGLRQISFFVIPTMTAYLALGDVVIAALYKTGKFAANDVRNVWWALMGCSLGLLASTLGRLCASTYYALMDTRSPLRIAIVRVSCATVLGYVAGIELPVRLGFDRSWGIVGLTVASSFGAWVEFILLQRYLQPRVGRASLSWSFLWRVGVAALASSTAGLAVKAMLEAWIPRTPAYLSAIPIFGTFGLVYLSITAALKVPEVMRVIDRIKRRAPRRAS